MTLMKGWSRGELAWLVTATAIVGVSSWGSSALEFAAALTNVLCVILVAKGRVSNYYWGLAGVLLYGYSSYLAGFYGNMTLNLVYYAPMQLIGWYMWKANTGDQLDVPVRRLTPSQAINGCMAITAAVVGLMYYLTHHTDNPSPFADAFTTIASVVAMYLMVKQYSEQWILWIGVNVVSIYMWVIPALHGDSGYALVGMWSVFLINSLYGAYQWFWVKKGK